MVAGLTLGEQHDHGPPAAVADRTELGIQTLMPNEPLSVGSGAAQDRNPRWTGCRLSRSARDVLPHSQRPL